MASKLKALAHPARIAIIEHLLMVKTCVCGDIVDAVPLAQATISQHLKALKEAEIIQGKIAGTSVCYCLNENAFQEIRAYFDLLVEQQGGIALNCC
ncbi:MAG: ArsR/SmtB family transcription factor [Bacteroidia bacterium]